MRYELFDKQTVGNPAIPGRRPFRFNFIHCGVQGRGGAVRSRRHAAYIKTYLAHLSQVKGLVQRDNIIWLFRHASIGSSEPVCNTPAMLPRGMKLRESFSTIVGC